MEKLTAKQARELSDENRIKIEQVLKAIESTTQNGCTGASFEYLRQDEILELVRLGYKISEGYYPNGQKFTLVEW